MKTNSKLYKRLLVFALVACMLCSVLVAGIGTGMIAKAETTTYSDSGSTSTVYSSTDMNDQTGEVKGNTATVSFDTSKFASITFDGTITPTLSVTVSGLELKEGTDTYITGWVFNGWWGGITNNPVKITADGTYNVTVDTPPQWSEGFAMAQVEVTGFEKIGSVSATLSVTVETTTEDTETESPSDTEEETDASTGTFYYTDTGTWKNANGDFTYGGSGTYKFTVLPDAVGGSPAVGPNNYIQFPDIATALADAGYTTDDATITITVKMDGADITAETNAMFDFSDNQAKIFNPWGGVGIIDTIWTETYEVIVEISLPEELGTGSCDITIGTPAEDEDDGNDEPLKGTTGTKKENGYVHDKGAIFVYTGSKDINDFTIATGWAFGTVHEINGKWGDSYFGDGGITGPGTGDGVSVKGNGIYVKYWEDYRGIGYPAIQLSWDTDRIFYIGDITIFSSDWSTQAVFSVGDGFYRGPEERYAGTGEALLDGSNRWYYFGEGSYTAASTTTTEDTTTETIDTSDFTNGDLGLGDGEAGAYIMYADESWTNQYWYDGSVYTMNPENVKITGEGDYVVGLTGQASGLAFTALGIAGGEAAYPNYCFTITAMTVNGELINFEKPYTSSDDGITTRSNIYNAWVSELPDDARCAYGELADCTWVPVDPADFANVTEFKVYFTVTAPETELDYDAKVVETLTNLVNDGTLTQEAVDQYIIDNEIVVPEA